MVQEGASILETSGRFWRLRLMVYGIPFPQNTDDESTSNMRTVCAMCSSAGRKDSMVSSATVTSMAETKVRRSQALQTRVSRCYNEVLLWLSLSSTTLYRQQIGEI